MLASSQLDLCVGLDIHMEMVPVPPAPLPVPTPFPMPFVGMIEFSPGGLLLSVGIAAAMSAAFSTPPSGPVLVNGMQATKTGDEAQNKKTMPHMVIPPGIAWTPLPKPLKLKMKPGPPPAPDPPANPPGDAVMVTGSKTVYFEQSNACRLGTLAMSCSDPVRMPSSVLLAIPKGLPVLIGGPPTFDWSTAAKAFFLRNKWTAGLLHQLVSLLPPGRFRNLLSWAACELTGHPVDVATGRLLTRAKDFELRGPIPLTFERFYSTAWAERDSPLGFGWSHTFDERIWVERGKVVYKTGDGRELEFHTYDLRERKMRQGQELFYPIDRLTLRCLGGGRWEIRTTDGLTREFALLPGDSQVSHLTKIRNRVGQWVGFEHDSTRLLDGVRTSEGRWVRFEHRRGRLHRVAVPYPHGDQAGWYDQVSFGYSNDGDLVAATDSARRARTYRYENHLLVQETDRDGVTFYFEYDGRDSTASCVRTWGNDGKGGDRLYFREIVYDKKSRRTLVEDSLGATTIYEMNAANAVVKITNPHAAVTTREYDNRLWKTAETTALGASTTFEYDARGNETKRVLPSGATFAMTYNAEDRITGAIDPFGVRTNWEYDLRTRLVAYATSTGERVHIEYGDRYPSRMIRSDGTIVGLEHDAFGQVTSLTRPDGSTEQRWYDRQGRLTKHRDATGRAHRIDYDLEGRILRVEHPGGAVREFEYSPEGDLLAEVEPFRTETYGYAGFHQLAWREEAGARIELRRDSEDDLLTFVNEKGETYTFEYDACRRVKTEVTFEGRTRSFVRDADGRVTTVYMPDKRMVTLERDAFGNVTRVSYADGEEESFTYDQLGNLDSATNSAGTLRFERDGRRRIVREHFGDDWVSRSHDSLGQSVEVASSKGLAERISRGPEGHVQAIGLWEIGGDRAARPLWHVGFERDGAGAEHRRRLPGGVDVRSDWDDAGLPRAKVVSRQGDVVDRCLLHWEGLDRLVSRSDTSLGETKYLHDARGRLAAASVSGGTTAWRAPDATGNLFKTEDRSDRRYGRGGVLLEAEGTTFAYDALGNVIEKTLPDGRAWKYAWNAAGFLTELVTPDERVVGFTYDALGRRVSKTVDGDKTTRWLWNGDVPMHEWTECGGERGALTTWVFEPDGFTPLGKVTSDGERLSIVSDYLGTPEEMFDAAGRLAWKAQLDLYGVAKVDEGTASDCPWRWQGQYEDEETGLYYNRFRYYDPQRGDYISQDPTRLWGLSPGATLYSYTGDPLIWIDVFALNGVIYLRILRIGGVTVQEYVGKSIAFAKRQAAHNRALNKIFPGQKYIFIQLANSVPVADLAKTEEDWIRAGGGPGVLANKRHEQSDDNYKNAGGCVPK